MKWKSPRNGGNSASTRFSQSRASRNAAGHGEGFSGHHSWRKGHGGGNKIGAITSPLGEWSSKGRKEEERHSYAAKQAELDVIQEGLAEVWEEEYGAPSRFTPEYVSDQILEDVCGEYIPGVSLNGVQFDGHDDSFDYYPDVCHCCGRPF
jgi:hypothetical protein